MRSSRGTAAFVWLVHASGAPRCDAVAVAGPSGGAGTRVAGSNQRGAWRLAITVAESGATDGVGCVLSVHMSQGSVDP